MEAISLADAKARFSELVARAEAGEPISITKRGKPVVRLVAETPEPMRIEMADLQRLTDGMAPLEESASESIRRLRDGTRF